jgi:UDPglucose 6-dehydrogenase
MLHATLQDLMAEKKRVGIVGLGAVGTAVAKGMEPHHEIVGYDIDGRGDWDSIPATDAVLVCVPTDLSKKKGAKNLDTGPVLEVATRLDESSYAGVVILKSTLNVGTMECLQESHPELRLVYMPEFLREKDAVEWFADPDRLIASGEDEDVEEALALFEWVDSDVPRMAMKHKEAEIGKLAHNAYIATKVTFTCEIERLCLLHDVNPHPVMETVWRDRRVLNQAHLTPGLGGFDGKCVPKDTEALASIDDRDGGLLQHVLKIGTKERVEWSHNRAKEEFLKQPPGKISRLLDGLGKVILGLFGFALIMGLLLSWMFGMFALDELSQYDHQYVPQHYIVDSNDISFTINELDRLTILNFNSSVLDTETTYSTYCSTEYDGEGGSSQSCDTYTTTFPVLIIERGNHTFALTGWDESFIEDCYQSICTMVGKVVYAENSYYWVDAHEYRTF